MRGQPPRAAAVTPGDIYPESGNRLPLVRRNDLAEVDRELYDAVVTNPRSIAGLRGPGGIRLHNPRLARMAQPYQEFLRFHPELERTLAELAILVAAREMDSQFEWTAHEPTARREGLDSRVIEVVKDRAPIDGLPDREAAIIQLGREAIRQHRVSPATYARALELFGKEVLIHLVALMGQYLATAILLATFDQQVPADQEPLLPVR